MESNLSPALRPRASRPATCSGCGTELKRGELFCTHCGPPLLPPEEPPENGLSPGQAAIRILLLLVLFGGVVYYKIGPSVSGSGHPLFQPPGGGVERTAPGNLPKDKDYQVVHRINVPFANLREKATTQSRVLEVLERGQEVKVLYKGEQWTQVEFRGRTGWVASRLLDSRVE